MAGYTRQSSANMISGNTIYASDLNNEYNAIQSAFDGNTGHAHDGTTGNGPKINLTTSITGTLPILNGGTGGINNLSATVAPSTSADSNAGYRVGSLWIDTTNDIVYICVDATVATAIWVRHQVYALALASIAGLTTSANQTIYTTASNAYATTALTAFGRSIIDDADAAAGRATLALGTIATQNANAVAITGGTISGITDLAIADGGTGASDVATARTNFGLGTMATQNANAVAITGGSVTGITDITVADGGTGASTAAAARTNLGTDNASNITSGTLTDARLPSTMNTKTFTGVTNLPSVSETSFAQGTGDGASYTLYNTILKGWWGMGMMDHTNTVNGYYDFRAGKWDTKGGMFKNGVEYVKPDGGTYSINITGSSGNSSQLGGIAAASYALLNSPALTGTPTAPTAGGGTNNTQIATTAFVTSAIAASGTRYTSSQQTFTAAGLVTVAHGLGVRPRDITLELVCTTADANYAVGDILYLAPAPVLSNSGYSIYATSTNVNVRVGSAGIGVADKSTGGGITITSANWRMVVKAST